MPEASFPAEHAFQLKTNALQRLAAESPATSPVHRLRQRSDQTLPANRHLNCRWRAASLPLVLRWWFSAAEILLLAAASGMGRGYVRQNDARFGGLSLGRLFASMGFRTVAIFPPLFASGARWAANSHCFGCSA